MNDHLNLENAAFVQSCLLIGAVKVDIQSVQDVIAVDAESHATLLDWAFCGLAFVFNSELGFTSIEHIVVNLAFVVLCLYDQ